MSTPPSSPLVLVFSRRLLAPVMVLFAVLATGMVWAIVDAVTHHDAAYPWRDSGLGPTGRAVGWVVLAVLLLALVGTAPILVRLRFVLTPDAVTGRVVLAEHTLRVDDLIRVRALRARRGGYVPQAPRVRITGRDADGRRRSLVLNATFSGLGLDVIGQWVSRRPELVRAGDAESGRVFARALGTPARPAAPPIGGFATLDGTRWRPTGSDSASTVIGGERPDRVRTERPDARAG